jgi:hypothetical protein
LAVQDGLDPVNSETNQDTRTTGISQAAEKIERFLRAARVRINLQIVYVEWIRSMTVFGVGALLVCAWNPLVHGQKVDLVWLTIPALVAVLFWASRAFFHFSNQHEAARHADSTFNLQNALMATVEFSKIPLHDGFHDLHRIRTADRISLENIKELRVHSVSAIHPVLSIAMLTGCVVLCLLDDRPEVRLRREQEKTTENIGHERNKELRETMIQIRETMTPKERALFDASQLPRRIESLKSSGDTKELMRQYAALERDVQRMAERNQLDQEEKMLAAIAKKLMQSRDGSEMGKHLSQNRIPEAARKLEEMHRQASDGMEKKEAFRKLVETMRNSTRDFSQDEEDGLKSRLDRLSESLTSEQKSQDGDRKGEKGEKGRNTQNAVQALTDHLRQHADKKEYFQKLAGIRRALADAQAGAATGKMGMTMGEGKATGKGQGQGKGKGIGDGIGPSGNDDPGTRRENAGVIAQIEGQKGKGPGDVRVAETGSGSGEIGRESRAAGGEARLQFEHFLRREDVPDGMKDGVKRYFETIHEE